MAAAGGQPFVRAPHTAGVGMGPLMPGRHQFFTVLSAGCLKMLTPSAISQLGLGWTVVGLITMSLAECQIQNCQLLLHLSVAIILPPNLFCHCGRHHLIIGF